MSGETVWLLAACMFLGATLYSSVGHGGASAYLALMALFGLAPEVMRPTALTLNIIVASLASYRFARAGLFRWRVLWPFLLGALPFAFLGGAIQLPGHFYRPLVGMVMFAAALRFLWPTKPERAQVAPHDPPIPVGGVCGVAIGFLSGLTGTGGGTFLSPLLLFRNWSDPRTASGIAALFILCTSVAGLLGNLASVRLLPAELPIFVAAALAGGLAGTTLGVHRFSPQTVRRALGAVLVVAGIKLVGLY